jgi:DNA-binding beta-propeller fold protein YncE
MLGAVDGAICEFELQGNAWQEVRRWNSWGTGNSEHFGSQVYITRDGNQLWVSDSIRNRVLCFDLQTRKLLGSFGQMDHPGDDLEHFTHPAAIAARHGRVVVFDSDNQRLVKLQFSGS